MLLVLSEMFQNSHTIGQCRVNCSTQLVLMLTMTVFVLVLVGGNLNSVRDADCNDILVSVLRCEIGSFINDVAPMLLGSSGRV